VDLHHDETTTNDKWLTLGAICKLIYTRFDFDAGIDFTVRELKKAANELGPLGSKILQGNHTGIHLRLKYTRMSRITCVLLSRSKDTQLKEPTGGKAWTQALEPSEGIAEAVSQTVQIKTFRKRSASETLTQTDLCIAQLLRQQISIPQNHHSSPTSTGYPQSSNNQPSSDGSPDSSGTETRDGWIRPRKMLTWLGSKASC
jgi:hypothetical protein